MGRHCLCNHAPFYSMFLAHDPGSVGGGADAGGPLDDGFQKCALHPDR